MNMILRTALMTASALGLLMGSAMADSNNAVLVQGTTATNGTGNVGSIDQSGGSNNTSKAMQVGNTNSLDVTQDGSGNRAGTHIELSGPFDPSDAARGYNFMSQKGDSNVLEIDQSSNGNIVAVDGNVVQSGDQNLISITQVGKASSGNRVNSVTQTDSSGTAASRTNELRVQQSGAPIGTYSGLGSSDYNYTPNLVNSVTQTHVGTGVKNYLSVIQTGAVFGRGNVVTTALQNGVDNSATVEQNGRSNRVSLLSQIGSGHRANVDVTGDNNGAGLLSAGAAVAGASSSTVDQSGTGNQVNYAVLAGNGNEYGFRQYGDGNLAIGISITGDGNELGVNQDGDDNQLTLGVIVGSDNVVGLRQDGNSNRASLTIAANGSRNGGYSNFTPLNVAAELADGIMTAGLMDQIGDNNRVTLNITGSDNVFATLQNNSSYLGATPINTITGTISGTGNQAAVAQVGNANVSHFTQNGSSNVMAVSQ